MTNVFSLPAASGNVYPASKLACPSLSRGRCAPSSQLPIVCWVTPFVRASWSLRLSTSSGGALGWRPIVELGQEASYERRHLVEVGFEEPVAAVVEHVQVGVG
jgi:hypothetical protein